MTAVQSENSPNQYTTPEARKIASKMKNKLMRLDVPSKKVRDCMVAVTMLVLVWFDVE